MMELTVDYNRLADFPGVLDRVFRPAFAIRGNEGMKNVAVFSDQSIPGIKSLGKNMAG